MGNLSQMDDMIMQWTSDPFIGKLVLSAIGILVIVVVIRLLQRAIVARYIEDTGLRYRVRKIVTGLGYVLVFLFVGSVFSAKLSQLTVAFGIAGAGIAFALQEVIMSVAGWVAIVFGDFYKTGDRIRLGGVKGDVIDIGIFRTTVMECGDWVNGDLYNGRIVQLTNSYVFKEPVFNYSDDFPFLWDEIVIPVHFGSDPKFAREILMRVANEIVGDYSEFAREAWVKIVRSYRIEDARVEPLVTMGFDENWMSFTVRYVVDYKARRITKDRLFTRVYEEFAATQGRVNIASAAMEIALTQVPKLHTHVSES